MDFKALVERVVENIHAQREAESEAHQKLRSQLTSRGEHEHMPGIMQVGKTGVIYVMARASQLGFSYGNEEWANFGQGAPETGKLPNQPERKVSIVADDPIVNEYGPVAGIKELREQVANLYNVRYREGKESKYTYENVCICPGGRAALTRVAACIGDVNVGFFLPDYTAYEQMLSVFKNFCPIPKALHQKNSYRLTQEQLKTEVSERGLSVILTSNPGNPTGQLVDGEDLKHVVDIAREERCSMIMDEFYSHYVYKGGVTGRMVSSAEYVNDVNKDPIIIVDGLTKNWRLPGWRCCWVIGPKELIEAMQSSGSFLDGGASHPIQHAVANSNLLDPDFVRQDALALQQHFSAKRELVLKRLAEIGMLVECPSEATFYVWVNLENLPAPLNNGMGFFEEALKFKVICVPGIMFDVNPNKRRELFSSPYHHYVRLSIGPPMEQLEKGLDAFERMIQHFKELHAVRHRGD